MNNIFMVTGVSGSGKDFIINKLKPCIPRDFSIFNFGQELFKDIRGNNSLVGNSDSLKNLDYEIINQSLIAVAERVVQSQPVIVNTHVVYINRGDLIFTPEINYLLQPLIYIHITAPVVDVFDRRLDSCRSRPTESITRIKLHQDTSIFITRRIAKELGAEFINIWNRKGNVNSNIKILSNTLRKYL